MVNLNQEVTVESKIKSVIMMMMSSGTCSFTCKFDKDMCYPGDILKVQVDVDNSKCSKKIEKYKIKLLRRT